MSFTNLFPKYPLSIPGATGPQGPTGPTGPSATPIGGIILWSGSVDYIPINWSLCDGTNGTPDLRNSFIVGAGTGISPSNYSVGAQGGSSIVTLTDNNLPTHTHSLQFNSITTSISGGGDNRITAIQNQPSGAQGDPSYTVQTGQNTTTNTGFSILPPYYALCYIMRISE